MGANENSNGTCQRSESCRVKARATAVPSSHLICLTTSRGRQINAATSAAGATKPQANSAAVCGRPREEKSVQFTVHDGRTNPGSAVGGTRHCQCAAADCNSRAEPWTRSSKRQPCRRGKTETESDTKQHRQHCKCGRDLSVPTVGGLRPLPHCFDRQPRNEKQQH